MLSVFVSNVNADENNSALVQAGDGKLNEALDKSFRRTYLLENLNVANPIVRLSHDNMYSDTLANVQSSYSTIIVTSSDTLSLYTHRNTRTRRLIRRYLPPVFRGERLLRIATLVIHSSVRHSFSLFSLFLAFFPFSFFLHITSLSIIRSERKLFHGQSSRNTASIRDTLFVDSLVPFSP